MQDFRERALTVSSLDPFPLAQNEDGDDDDDALVILKEKSNTTKLLLHYLQRN